MVVMDHGVAVLRIAVRTAEDHVFGLGFFEMDLRNGWNSMFYWILLVYSYVDGLKGV